MIDIALDRNNFAWISFTNGIQKFDGKNFSMVPQQPGLPEDKSVQFFLTAGKKLLITHSKGITWYDIDNNKFKHVFVNSSGYQYRLPIVGEDDGIVYFLHSPTRLIGLETETFKKVRESTINFPIESLNGYIQIRCTENVAGHRVGIYTNSTFYLWDLKAGKLISQSDKIGTTAHYAANIRMKSPDEIYFFSRDPDLYLNSYHFSTREITRLIKGPVQSARTFRSSLVFWNGQPYISHYNELHQCSEKMDRLTGRVVNFQNQDPAGESSITYSRQDNFGNLFVLTINKGFRKILNQNYPVKYFGVAETEKNYYGCVVADKANNRIVGGSYINGLYIFDTTQRLVKNINRLPGNDKPFTPGSIVKLDDGSYLVFVTGYSQPWRLRSDLSKFSLHPVENKIDSSMRLYYFSNPVSSGAGNVLVFSDKVIFRINLKTGKVRIQAAESLPRLCYPFGSNYVSHEANELIFVDTTSLQLFKTVPLLNTGGVRCFLPDGNGNMYLGTNKGIFKINGSGKTIMQINKHHGLPDECIYAMTWDADSALWCSTNRGILKIRRDLAVLQLRKEDGLQENEFNTNAVYRSDDNEIFFAGINGMSSFYPAAISSFPDSLTVLLTGLRLNNEVHIGDTAIWNLKELTLPHNRNVLSFDFLAMGSHNPDQYIYQYRMKGIEDDWIQGNVTQQVRYHLNPGTYHFQLFASRQFDPSAKPIHELTIIIKLPFWKTWWFLTCLGIVAIILFSYVINARTRRKYRKKLRILEHEKQIKQERERISRDLHDNLGVYANAVMHNAQLLETEKANEQKERLLSELGFASRNIITSLKETVWALKYEEFSAEECLLRIRNFIQPLTRYYTGIEFKVTGEAPSQLQLHYTKALNLVRILQEAISNSIKHGSARNIVVHADASGERWVVSVIDDGTGFDAENKTAAGEGNGLFNMETRASESGFALSIQSNLQGTVISVTV